MDMDRHNQRGVGFLGIVIILGVIAFFALVALKVTPLLLENQSVNSALDALEADPDIGKRGKGRMISKLEGQFYVNDIKNVDPNNFVFTKEKKVWKIAADYRAETVLFKNVGVFINFKRTVEVARK